MFWFESFVCLFVRLGFFGFGGGGAEERPQGQSSACHFYVPLLSCISTLHV